MAEEPAAEAGETIDVAIVGGGPVGLASALSIARLGLSVQLFDARAAGAWAGDPRAIALSEGSRAFLASLGAWPSAGTTPITGVHVSQLGGCGRTLIEARDHGLAALGHVVTYGTLCDALAAALRAHAGPSCRLHWQAPVHAAGSARAHCRIDAGGRRWHARLLIHAEGSGDEGWQADYRQDALLCTVQPAAPHAQHAWERFTPQGPVALLPHGERFACVFVVPRAAGRDLETDDSAFLAALTARFAQRLDFVATGPRQRVPLALRVRPRTADARSVWLGNAAQSLHPISGQGLNLGLRDAAALADALAELLGGDPAADPAACSVRLALRRLPDRTLTIGFTDLLVRGFAGDFPPLRAVRGLALTLFDLLPPARAVLAAQMIFGQRS